MTVPDIGDGKPRLAIIHHQALHIASAVDEVPEMIATIYQRKGQDGAGLRQLRNNLVFLVADERHVPHMTATVSRHLALRELNRPDRLGELADHQRAQVIELAKRSETEIAVSVQQCYRHLFYPSRTTLGSGNLMLDLATIDQHSASERPGSGQTQIVRLLSSIGKLRTPEDNPDQPAYIRDRTPLKRSGQMSAAELRAEFRRDPALPMHVGDDPFRKLVRKGINDGVFVYQREALTAGQGDPEPSIIIDETSIISTAEYAKDHGIFPRLVRKEEASSSSASTDAPKDGQASETAGGVQKAGEGSQPSPAPAPHGPSTSAESARAETQFASEGVLKDALTTVFRRAREAKVEKIVRLAITPFEAAHFYLLLNVVETLPSSTKTATATIDFETSAGSIMHFTFEGQVADAKQTREYFEPQLRAAAERTMESKICIDFTEGLILSGDEAEKIIDRLTKFGTAAAFVEVTAEA